MVGKVQWFYIAAYGKNKLYISCARKTEQNYKFEVLLNSLYSLDFWDSAKRHL